MNFFKEAEFLPAPQRFNRQGGFQCPFYDATLL